MSDPVILALIGMVVSVVASIAAVATGFISLRTSRKSDVIIEKTAEIHTLANSNMHQVTEALAIANEKISGLEKLIAAGVESKKEAQIKAENDAQKLLSEAVILASKKVQANSNQPNSE